MMGQAFGSESLIDEFIKWKCHVNNGKALSPPFLHGQWICKLFLKKIDRFLKF